MKRMEALFSTNLTVDGRDVVYQVYEDGGKYVFLSEHDDNRFRSFSLVREGDRWSELELNTAPGLKKEAMEALDRYLFTNPA